MKRTGPSLSEIPRHELVAAALELGIERPEQLSPEQLREKIRAASSAPGANGARVSLFSVARNLIASVVERGLNLPDAARVIRDTVRPSPRHRPPLPTVTLAQIYLAQGYTDRALQTLDAVIEREPDNYKAVELRQRLSPSAEPTEGPTEPGAPPPVVGRFSLAPGLASPAELWHAAGASLTRGVRDALVLVQRDEKQVTVYWELAERHHADVSRDTASVRVLCFCAEPTSASAGPREIHLPVRAAYGWAVVELLDEERPSACLVVGSRVVAAALHVRLDRGEEGSLHPSIANPRRGFWQDVVERALQ